MAVFFLRWHGHVLACKQCGSQHRWTLIIDRPADHDGEVAWLECSNKHRAWHPLIYPEFVRRLIRDGNDEFSSSTVQVGWMPHWLSTTAAHDRKPVPDYRPWTEPGPVKWQQDWPSLVEAQQQWDNIQANEARCARAGLDTSWSILSNDLYGLHNERTSLIRIRDQHAESGAA